MDYSVEGPESVDLFRNVAGLSDARQITDDYTFRAGDACHRLLATFLVAGMQNYAVTLLDEEFCGHLTQPIGRTGDEYPRHVFPPSKVYLTLLRAAKGGERTESADLLLR